MDDRAARLERAEDAIHEVLDITAATTEELSKMTAASEETLEKLGADFLRVTEEVREILFDYAGQANLQQKYKIDVHGARKAARVAAEQLEILQALHPDAIPSADPEPNPNPIPGRSAMETPSGRDLPDFAVTAGGDGDKAHENVDPNNDGIAVDDDSRVEFLGRTLSFQGGSTKCARKCVALLGRDEALRESLAGQRVLEVGSGTGVVGTALALAGAVVDLTDQAYVVELLEHNVRENLGAVASNAKCFELVWGADAELPASNGGEPYRAIFAADLVYAKEAHLPLLEVFRKLGTPETDVYLAYIHRFPWEKRFFDLMATLYDRELLAYDDGIWLYRFRPRADAM
uniref:Uncharacterized protein n=1 Tax=Phaeomonas parva TaxID=124430 RepID=A0A7S1XQG2_9STRA|mmetsp:Transcript_23926/g.75384  ORF Transcript_23926/g.75384 Transcript_23926/m.75384 type:complete len:346 (+) Transcript_23926:122-1159(+)